MAPSASRSRLYTLPNLLTLLRPACTGPFVLLCAQLHPTALPLVRWGAGLLFLFIVASDLLDGWLARRLHQESTLGRTLDHVCDVLFILTALGYFVTWSLVPWWLPVAIAWAFCLYVFDSWWSPVQQSQPTLRASRLGHLGGMLSYGAVGLVTGNLVAGKALFPLTFLHVFFMLLALLALASGIQRLYHLLRRR